MSTIAVFLVLASGAAWAGKKLIKGSQIKNGAISTKKLKNGAVTEAKIGSQAVDTGNLVDKAAKQGKIGQNAIITEKLADGAVTPAKTSFEAASGRVTLNPPANQTVDQTLVAAAGITLVAHCAADVADSAHAASVEVLGPATSFLTGVRGGSAAPTSVFSTALPDIPFSTVSTASFAAQHASFDVISPTSTLSASITAAVNMQSSDCVFSASGVAG
jgi:hypothetical protein